MGIISVFAKTAKAARNKTMRRFPGQVVKKVDATLTRGKRGMTLYRVTLTPRKRRR